MGDHGSYSGRSETHTVGILVVSLGSELFDISLMLDCPFLWALKMWISIFLHFSNQKWSDLFLWFTDKPNDLSKFSWCLLIDSYLWKTLVKTLDCSVYKTGAYAQLCHCQIKYYIIFRHFASCLSNKKVIIEFNGAFRIIRITTSFVPAMLSSENLCH